MLFSLCVYVKEKQLRASSNSLMADFLVKASQFQGRFWGLKRGTGASSGKVLEKEES